jgi:hypothetical protein
MRRRESIAGLADFPDSPVLTEMAGRSARVVRGGRQK